jgi:ATP-dependent protease ClpP protease subunit
MGECSMKLYKDYMRVQAIGITYHFYVHGQIGDSEDYVDLLDTLYTATYSDVVMIHLNTPGGYLNTAVEMIHAMAQCQATVITCADGQVASAGSLIFFAGESMILGEFCEVMLHDGSGGNIGKINENLKSAEFTAQRLSHIYHKIYGKFFEHEEIEAILNGQDLYLNAEEVECIVDRYLEKINKEQNEQEQQDSE